MDNTSSYPHFVTVAFTAVNLKFYQHAMDDRVIPASVFVIERDDDFYELPEARLLPSDGGMKECAVRCAVETFGAEGEKFFDRSGIREIGTYMVPAGVSSTPCVLTAYEYPLSFGKEMPRGTAAGEKGVWRGLNAMQCSIMGRGHNGIVNDVIASYSSQEPTFEDSLQVLAQAPSLKNTRANRYNDKTGTTEPVLSGMANTLRKDQKDAFVANLHEMGFHIYKHSHPEVATDVVAFGYSHGSGDEEEAAAGQDGLSRNQTEDGRKDELSILLVRRSHDTPRYPDRWALPGCFLKDDVKDERKSAVDSAQEALLKEAGLGGLRPTEIHPLPPFTAPDRDEEENARVISLPYFWITKKVNPDYANRKLKSKSTSEYQWFPVRRVLYDKESGVRVRFDNTVLVKEENGTYVKSAGKTVKPRFRRDGNGKPETNVYLKDGCLWVEYFVDERFDTEDYKNSREEDHLAFDHADIIVAALDALREQTHFRPVLAGLLPPQFKLVTFQRLWEALLWPWMFEPSNFQKGIKIDEQDKKEKRKAFIRRADGPVPKLYELDLERYMDLLEDNLSLLQ